MRQSGKFGSRLSAALVAAAMLVLQAWLGAFAMGSAGASPMLDAFGNPLCITSPLEDPSDSRDHTAMPDCCTSACSMAAQAPGTDRAVSSLANPLRLAAPVALDLALVRELPAPDHDPGRPRAPPQAD